MTTIDIELSRFVHAAVLAQKQQCYGNAAMGLLLDVIAAMGVVYVEGYIVLPEPPVMIEHAWLQLPNGAIIEPTLPLTSPFATYFTGKTYTHDTVYRHAVTHRLPLPLCDKWWLDPDLVKASEEALAFMRLVLNDRSEEFL